MLIQVIYQSDKRFGAVHKFRLEKLIKSGQLFAFRRANEWVIVEKGPVRGAGGSYSGPERRNTASCLEHAPLVTDESDVQISSEQEGVSLESKCLKVLEL